MLLLPKRTLLSGGRSLGTIRPPAVTRNPGGLPCSLSSRSALPRLIDGDGDGFFKFIEAAETPGATDAREKGLSEEVVPIKFADAEGLRTCSVR